MPMVQKQGAPTVAQSLSRDETAVVPMDFPEQSRHAPYNIDFKLHVNSKRISCAHLMMQRPCSRCDCDQLRSSSTNDNTCHLVLMSCCLCVPTFSLECSAIATDLNHNFWVLNVWWLCTSNDSNENSALRLAALPPLPLGSSSHVGSLFHFGPFVR